MNNVQFLLKKNIHMQRSSISESSCNYVMKNGKRRIHKLDGMCAKDEDSVCKWISLIRD